MLKNINNKYVKTKNIINTIRKISIQICQPSEASYLGQSMTTIGEQILRYVEHLKSEIPQIVKVGTFVIEFLHVLTVVDPTFLE